MLSSQIREQENIQELKHRLQQYLKGIKRDSHLHRLSTTKKVDEALRNGEVEILLKTDAELFCIGLHAKVANYLQLYAGFINVGRYFMLAHNQFVSIYNLALGEWTSHDKFDETVRAVFRNRKSGNQKSIQFSEIGVLVGSQTFRFYKFSGLGKMKLGY